MTNCFYFHHHSSCLVERSRPSRRHPYPAPVLCLAFRCALTKSHRKKKHDSWSFQILNIYSCLVVWNMAFIFPYIGNVIIPTDEFIFFQRGRSTTNQIVMDKKKTPGINGHVHPFFGEMMPTWSERCFIVVALVTKLKTPMNIWYMLYAIYYIILYIYILDYIIEYVICFI